MTPRGPQALPHSTRIFLCDPGTSLPLMRIEGGGLEVTVIVSKIEASPRKQQSLVAEQHLGLGMGSFAFLPPARDGFSVSLPFSQQSAWLWDGRA